MIRPVIREVVSPVIRSVIDQGAVTRRFMEFMANANSFISVPAIPSGQSVTMTVYPVSGGNTGLPAGAPAVTNGVWQTITFTLTAQMDDIGFDGTNYFNGLIWDVRADGAGRFYALNDSLDANVIVNTGSAGASANGQAFNIAAPVEYTMDGTDWLGPDVNTAVIPAGVVFINIGGFEPGARYRATFTPVLDVDVLLPGTIGTPTAPSGSTTFDFTQGTGTVIGMNSQAATSAGFTVTFKRLLESA